MASLSRNSKRGDYSEQIRNLKAAFEGSSINPALPYTSQIVSTLRNSIVDMKLLPGTPISEAAIAEVLGISRTPVREALKDLSTESFVDIFPQAGTVVSPIRISLIEQGNFVRRALESANLINLADLMTPEAEHRINGVLNLQAKALEQEDIAAFVMHDEAMHKLFFELTNRLPVWLIVLNSRMHVDRARQLLLKDDKTRSVTAYTEHTKIVNALFKRDKKQLMLALNAHVKNVGLGLQHYVQRTHSPWVID